MDKEYLDQRSDEVMGEAVTAVDRPASSAAVSTDVNEPARQTIPTIRAMHRPDDRRQTYCTSRGDSVAGHRHALSQAGERQCCPDCRLSTGWSSIGMAKAASHFPEVIQSIAKHVIRVPRWSACESLTLRKILISHELVSKEQHYAKIHEMKPLSRARITAIRIRCSLRC